MALSGQPTLRERGDEDTDAEVLDIPSLGSAWHKALEGLDTRLSPGVLRPITFDDQAAKDRTDIVHVHLGHALLQKSARILRNSLFGSDSRVHRVTAVVVPDLDYSCVAAVSRLVLVGRGGLRLHEEVFLTGIRIKGNEMAEDKVNDLLDRALDGTGLELASNAVRRQLTERWNADGSRMHARLTEAMGRRAERRQKAVTDKLDERRVADIDRARQIFAAFRTNLGDSLRALRDAEEEREFMLALPDDQRDQRRRDIARMEERLSTLADEESREVQSLRERYADVQPYVSAAAVVFALTPRDALRMGAAG